MKTYKIANEYDLIFKDYTLTELLTVQNGKKKGLGNNYSSYVAASHILKEYGVYLSGNTWVSNLYGGYNSPEIKIAGCSIDLDFPLENFFVLKQMYGWDDSCIDVQISLGEKFDNDCAYSFTMNTVDDSIVFNRWVYSSATSIKYNSLGDLFAALNSVDKAIELFETEIV